MSNKKKQWHSLGDFLQAKEERERTQAESQAAESNTVNVSTGVSTPVLTPVRTPVSTPVGTGVPEENTEQNPTATPSLPPSDTKSEFDSQDKQTYLDATHTASEQRIYSVMYRETLSKGQKERHFGFKELCVKTGIRSDRTMRLALDGLQEKLSVEIVSYFHGSPLGPRYRVYDPKEILKRRKTAGTEIDPQSKRIVSTGVSTGVPTGVRTGVPTGGKKYGSTPVESTGVTPVLSTGVFKYINNSDDASYLGEASSSNKNRRADDDEAFADFVSLLRENTREITGREPSASEAVKWRELAEVLITELRIAAGRTTVSSVPAFLAEHLRRRLWKLENRKQPPSTAGEPEAPEPTAARSYARECPDCWGTGMYYPGGFEKGVARCRHERLGASAGRAEDTRETFEGAPDPAADVETGESDKPT